MLGLAVTKYLLRTRADGGPLRIDPEVLKVLRYLVSYVYDPFSGFGFLFVSLFLPSSGAA